MPFEIDFLRAGDSNGDAIILKCGDTKDGDVSLHLIDGGFTNTGDQIIAHIKQNYAEKATIASVVLSHADNDHACGLIKVLEHEDFTFFDLWMNRAWDYVDEVIDSFHGSYTRDGLIKKMREMHPYLVELERIAEKRGITIRAPLQGAKIGPFTVLSPSRQHYVKLIPDPDKTPTSYASEARGILGSLLKTVKDAAERALERLDYETLDEKPPPTSASNETSVVQWASFGNERVLLTADVGPEGVAEAAYYAEHISLLSQPRLAQIPHHGSRRNVTPAVLDRWLGTYPAQNQGYAVASVGKNADIYPRTKVANAFTRRGYEVTATHQGWINFVRGYDRRPGVTNAPVIPFKPDVGDE
ncbi:MBL fold metallo-hydrolase [Bradyrhizobium sp. SZCCHNS3002]|uniref:MBL fold metallo-hydrolase n=1 Tax=Bradyrhizobium sp. SZCCHNS3002 TaxID=3057310 RepID=UPI0028E8EF5C|nr:MBL fold metallo-hydrolase [Bradyrhizobium sp. SZCCHNS3002]